MSSDWMADAACRGMDPSRFVPLPGSGHVVRGSIAICRTCVVIDDCARHAKQHGIKEGIWGGQLLGYPSRSGVDLRRAGRRIAGDPQARSVTTPDVSPQMHISSSDPRERGSVDQDFYRCPSTGDLVYRWADERMVLVPSDVLRRLRDVAGPLDDLIAAVVVPLAASFDLNPDGADVLRTAAYRAACEWWTANAERITGAPS